MKRNYLNYPYYDGYRQLNPGFSQSYPYNGYHSYPQGMMNPMYMGGPSPESYQQPSNPYNYAQQGSGYHSDLFYNPLLPDDDEYLYEKFSKEPPVPPMSQSNFLNQKPGGQFSSILNQFKTQDGSLDVNKMVNTAGQVVNAINQVSGMAKGLGGMFKA